VLEKVDAYLKLLEELDLKLVKAIDTHVHADHITALGALRDHTRCVTVMGAASKVDVVSMRVEDGDTIEAGNIVLDVLYTPGHTDDSYSFHCGDRVFTGDALFIRGTGRTDFQHGDPIQAYHSLFDKLLTLPGDTLVYPGHDYNGNTLSTIAEEKAHNPRLQVNSAEEYADIMNNLNLPNPKQMDVAVPANLSIGFSLADPRVLDHTVSIPDCLKELERGNIVFVDLRETPERTRNGAIPGSLHISYQTLAESMKPGGPLEPMTTQSANGFLLYCAYGERSAMALLSMLDAGYENIRHMGGGLDAWKAAGGKITSE
jgi:glyoxylase-like metal-dependent hydrolase (beta-lactamase superfamily II)/rhodanese-related sulfurtransferase